MKETKLEKSSYVTEADSNEEVADQCWDSLDNIVFLRKQFNYYLSNISNRYKGMFQPKVKINNSPQSSYSRGNFSTPQSSDKK